MLARSNYSSLLCPFACLLMDLQLVLQHQIGSSIRKVLLIFLLSICIRDCSAFVLSTKSSFPRQGKCCLHGELSPLKFDIDVRVLD